MAGSSRHHGNVTLSPLNHQIFQKFLCYISIAALGTFELLKSMAYMASILFFRRQRIIQPPTYFFDMCLSEV